VAGLAAAAGAADRTVISLRPSAPLARLARIRFAPTVSRMPIDRVAAQARMTAVAVGVGLAALLLASVGATTPTAIPPPILRVPGPPLSALDGPLELQSGYARIGFSQLAGFPFVAPPQPVPTGQPPPNVLVQVPAAIQRLDGRKVVLTGFMLPTKLENGYATEFLLLSSSQLCCYGITPALNEWIVVRMRKEGLPAVQDVPVALAGRLRVRARWSGGFLTSIYELEGDGLLKIKP